MALTGPVRELAEGIARNWLIDLRRTNPAILDMFHERDLQPYRDLLPWSGEFAGKYLTGAFYLDQLIDSAPLREAVADFIDELLGCIDETGYVGCYPRQDRLTGKFHPAPGVEQHTWDAWNHYHILYGLYLWYLQGGDARLLEAMERVAGLLMRTFYQGGARLIDLGSTETNLAPIHIFALLYRLTGKAAYLDFARAVEQDLSAPGAGDYIAWAQAGRDFYTCPQPRWEGLHVIMGLAELYRATGLAKYRQTVLQVFSSILSTDVHNTGAFSTDEHATGEPFTNGNIELCCAIAYNALAVEALLIGEDPAVADFLEISLYNAVMGSFSPTGRWSTYNTPMEGAKRANYQDIVFQSRPGSPELNCCSANAARGVGELSRWAVTEREGTVFLNYYGAATYHLPGDLLIQVRGDYPAENAVRIRIHAPKPRRVALRIPAWSARTWLSGGAEASPQPGAYHLIEAADIELTLQLDFTPHVYHGQGACAGKVSLYVGPVLYGYDLALNPQGDFDHLPVLTPESIAGLTPRRAPDGRILLRLPDAVLGDFCRLGATGSVYKTWFPWRP